MDLSAKSYRQKGALYLRVSKLFLDHLTIAGQQCDRAWTVEVGDASGVGQGGVRQIGKEARAQCRANSDRC